MTPVFLHGWGFDAAFWSAVRARLGGVVLDRGYFGAPSAVLPDGPLLLVGHSLGAMLWLERLPRGARALVAINGFDRFAAAPGWPGVAPRMLRQMAARFGEAPHEVLTAFRARCGAPPPPTALDVPRLADDLARLAEADARPAATRLGLPLLALDGGDDPILPAALRARVFESAPRLARARRPGGGHLLPVTDPGWCADAIAGFAASLP